MSDIESAEHNSRVLNAILAEMGRKPLREAAKPIETRRVFAKPNFRMHPLALAIRRSLAMGLT